MKLNNLQFTTMLFVVLTLLSAFAGASTGAYLYDFDLLAKGTLSVVSLYLLWKLYIYPHPKSEENTGLNIQVSTKQRIRFLFLSFMAALTGILSLLYIYDAFVYITGLF